MPFTRDFITNISLTIQAAAAAAAAAAVKKNEEEKSLQFN
jgi:hypothetical protein